jgi:hypothetical protein
VRRSRRYPLAAGLIVLVAFAVQAGFARPALADCATTSYWNVSYCIYAPHAGQTKLSNGVDQYDRISWSSNLAGYRKWLHTTGGGTWLEAPTTFSSGVSGDNTWLFQYVASTDHIGCFNPVESNTWVNCRRCNYYLCM